MKARICTPSSCSFASCSLCRNGRHKFVHHTRRTLPAVPKITLPSASAHAETGGHRECTYCVCVCVCVCVAVCVWLCVFLCVYEAVRLAGYTLSCGSECASKITPQVDRTQLVMAARLRWLALLRDVCAHAATLALLGAVSTHSSHAGARRRPDALVEACGDRHSVGNA